MLWAFGKVREKQLRRRAVALRQPYNKTLPYRYDITKKGETQCFSFFADRTRLISPLSPILCSRLYSFNYLANK